MTNFPCQWQGPVALFSMAVPYAIFQVMRPLYSQTPTEFGHLGCCQSFCLINNVALNIVGRSSSYTRRIRITFRSGVTGTAAKSLCNFKAVLLVAKQVQLHHWVTYVALEAACEVITSVWCQLDRNMSVCTHTRARGNVHIQASCIISLSLHFLLYKIEHQVCNLLSTVLKSPKLEAKTAL